MGSSVVLSRLGPFPRVGCQHGDALTAWPLHPCTPAVVIFKATILNAGNDVHGVTLRSTEVLPSPWGLFEAVQKLPVSG